MQSRVIRLIMWGAMPAGLGSMAARAFGDQENASAVASFGGKLKPPPCEQRQRLGKSGDNYTKCG